MKKYSNLEYSYGVRTTRYTFRLDDVSGLYNALKSKDVPLSVRSLDCLMIKRKRKSFEIHEFFLLEFEYMLTNYILPNPEIMVELNVLGLRDLVDYIRNETWLSERYTEDKLKHALNISDLDKTMKFKPLEHQKPAFDKYTLIKNMAGLRGGMLDAAPGTGKMERNSNRVLTPDGFKPICELYPGELIITATGEINSILEVYPHKSVQLYRVHLNDGRYLDVGGEHLWSVKTKQKSTVVNTLEMFTNSSTKYHIPTYSGSNYIGSKELILPPFIMGLFSSSDSLYSGAPSFTTRSIDIKNYITDNYSDSVHVVKDDDMYIFTIEGISYSNLNGDSSNIVIPETYYNLQYNEIVELLKGFVIGNIGYVSRINNRLYINNTNSAKLKALANVLWSRGIECKVNKPGRCSIRTMGLSETNKNTITINDMLHKLSLYTHERMSFITKVEKIDIADATCITISGPESLYVSENHVVTHNTYMSLGIGEMLEYDNVLIVTPKSTIDTVWIKSVTDELYKNRQKYQVLSSNDDRIDPTCRFYILHYQYVKKLMNNRKSMSYFKRNNTMLIVDEFHNFNELKSLQTSNLMKIVEEVDFDDILLLTGTPIKMAVKEVRPMLYILDRKFKPAMALFDQFYISLSNLKVNLIRLRFNVYRERIEKDTSTMPDIKLIQYPVSVNDSKRFTLDEIKLDVDRYKIERMSEIMDKYEVYESKFDSLINLVNMRMLSAGINSIGVTKTISKYRGNVTRIRKYSDDRKLYEIYDLINATSKIEKDVIRKYLIGEEKKEFDDVKSIIKYPELKVLGEALGKILLRRRIECYSELAKVVNYEKLLKTTSKKGLIFSNYINVCEEAVNRSKEMGFNPIGVYGEHVENLTDSVKTFNDLSTDTNPIVATYKSLSTGVPLTSANVIINIDLTFRMYGMEQALARAYRQGNDMDVTVFLVKLDTGDSYNLTDRDLYILKVSETNVELITGTSPEYTLPLSKEELAKEEEEVLEEIEDEVVKGIYSGVGDSVPIKIINRLVEAFKFVK